MKREELLKSKEYWLSKIQIDLFNEMNRFMEEKGLNRTQLAELLGVSKGYVSQIMNGDSDHRLSKLVELSLAVGLAPTVTFDELDKVIYRDVFDDHKMKVYEEIGRMKRTAGCYNSSSLYEGKTTVVWNLSYKNVEEKEGCCA
jgi:transcriptional regulator with XRE-family HTH domain